MDTSIGKALKKFQDFFKKGVHFLYELIKPKSRNEDLARREFILNILLLGSITLAIVIIVVSSIRLIIVGSVNVSLLVYLSGFIFYCILYVLSRRGFSVISSYIFIGIYFFPITYTIFIWGIGLPQALLIYALIIIMAGILISTRFALFITLLISFFLILITYLHENLIVQPDLSWQVKVGSTSDALVLALTLGVIMVVSWLSNREIEKSLRRAKRSEKALRKERDLLEIRVEERTIELKKAQLEKTMQLYRFADFGKMASGLFHDLVNPLTAISLNLEDLKENPKLSVSELKDRIERALVNVRNVSGLIEGSRKQIQKQEIRTNFSISYEINLSLQMLSFKARKADVALEFTPSQKNIHTYGNPVKFYRLIHDIVSNAIDSYEGLFQTDQKVIVHLKQKDKLIEIQVQDWGCGISKENLGKIFDPLFTTKGHEKGVGIGLTICKEMIEKDFGGNINVESEESIGTTFIIELPIKTPSRGAGTVKKYEQNQEEDKKHKRNKSKDPGDY